MSKRKAFLSLEAVVEKARTVHGYRFQYPGPYLGAQRKMSIICPVHGNFYQRPAEHYASPGGCPTCSRTDGAVKRSASKPDLSGKRFGKLTVVKRVGFRWECLCDCGGKSETTRKHLQQGKKKSCGFCPRGFDLTGKAFGRLVVIGRDISSRRGNGKCIKWICRCTCGSAISVESHALMKKRSQSCGCFKTVPDLTDEVFGRLRVMKRQGSVEGKTWGGATWLCECDCGKGRPVVATTNHLKSGGVKSCGCLSHAPCILTAHAADNLYVELFMDRDNRESFLKVGRTINSTARRYHGTKMYGHLERRPILLITDSHARIASLEYMITGRLPCQHASGEGRHLDARRFWPTRTFQGFTECFEESALFEICASIEDYCPNEFRQRIERDDLSDDRWSL